MNRFLLLRAALRRRTAFAAGPLVLLIGGCTEPTVTGTEPPPGEQETVAVPGLVISEPSGVLAGAAALASDGTAGATQLAYVSAEPGTFPRAVQIRIRNATSADPAMAVNLIDGGFDPVGISASEGDQLELIITDFDGSIRYIRSAVPPRRPPAIVRSNPPKGRTDVALSVQPVVIFSEPIDPQTVDATSIRLLRDGVVVSGAVALVAGSPFEAELTPETVLEPLTEYELVVTTAVRDLDGESLPEEYRVPFTTGSQPAAGGFRISNVTTGGAFDVDGYQVRVTLAGYAPRTVALELNTSVVIEGLPEGEASVELVDVAANCTVSGGASRTVAMQQSAEIHVEFQAACTPPPELGAVRLVFSKWEIHLGEVDLWTMNADGTDARQLTDGAWDEGPIVSPDRSRIAFIRGGWWDGEAHTMAVSGGHAASLFGGVGYSTIPTSWSPDGTRLLVGFIGGGIAVSGADGTGLQTLLSDGPTAGNGSSHNATWSPDGASIAFLRTFPRNGDPSCPQPTSSWNEIWVMDAQGDNVRFVRRLDSCWTSRGHLSWSSDGRIFFSDTMNDEGPSLWSVRPDGTGAVRLGEPNRFRMEFGAWSPDGRLNAMTREIGGPEWRTDVYLLNIENGTLTRITADGASYGAAFLR